MSFPQTKKQITEYYKCEQSFKEVEKEWGLKFAVQEHPSMCGKEYGRIYDEFKTCEQTSFNKKDKEMMKQCKAMESFINKEVTEGDKKNNIGYISQVNRELWKFSSN